MERLMGRVVAKPNLIADDRLNAKIERIFNVEAFQRMVENADLFQDVSSGNTSQMMSSFKRALPDQPPEEEEEDEEMPHFVQA